MELSVIIPAYNESERLPGFLMQALNHLDTEFHDLYEVLVVDDGSSDATATAVEKLIGVRPHVRLVHHGVNRGKGAAVQTGMLAAHGRLRLFADADGATPIEEERRLRKVIDAGADVAIGSRATRELRGSMEPSSPLPDEAEIRWEVKVHRYLIGRIFATLVKGILGLNYADTQCGFKMFRGDVAGDLFRRLTLPRFIFDVEILYLAERLGYRVVEIPVNWRDVPGSKVHLVRDSWRMFLGLWQIRHRHGQLGRSDPVPAADSMVEPAEMSELNGSKSGE